MPSSPLRELRVLRGLSQAALARALGVDLRTVSRWETSRVMPRAAQRRALERELEMDDDARARCALQAWDSGR